MWSVVPGCLPQNLGFDERHKAIDLTHFVQFRFLLSSASLSGISIVGVIASKIESRGRVKRGMHGESDWPASANLANSRCPMMDRALVFAREQS